MTRTVYTATVTVIVSHDEEVEMAYDKREIEQAILRAFRDFNNEKWIRTADVEVLEAETQKDGVQ
jgi:hypothetical protein